MEPDWYEVCGYCGEHRAGKLSCCGEVHFSEEPECPKCGDFVDRLQGVASGLEYEIFKCCHCDYVSEPE